MASTLMWRPFFGIEESSEKYYYIEDKTNLSKHRKEVEKCLF